jgi:hypothetical protein
LPAFEARIVAAFDRHAQVVGTEPAWNHKGTISALGGSPDPTPDLPDGALRDSVARARGHLQHAAVKAARVQQSPDPAIREVQDMIIDRVLATDIELHKSILGYFVSTRELDERVATLPSRPGTPRRQTLEAAMPSIWNAANALSRAHPNPERAQLPNILDLAIDAKKYLQPPDASHRMPLPTALKDELDAVAETIDNAAEEMSWARIQIPLDGVGEHFMRMFEAHQRLSGIEQQLTHGIHHLRDMYSNNERRKITTHEYEGQHSEIVAATQVRSAHNSIVAALAQLLKFDTTQLPVQQFDLLQTTLRLLNESLGETAHVLTAIDPRRSSQVIPSLLDGAPAANETRWVDGGSIDVPASSSPHMPLHHDLHNAKIRQMCANILNANTAQRASRMCDLIEFIRQARVADEEPRQIVTKAILPLLSSDDAKTRTQALSILTELTDDGYRPHSEFTALQRELLLHGLTYLTRQPIVNEDMGSLSNLVLHASTCITNPDIPPWQRLQMSEQLLAIARKPSYNALFSSARCLRITQAVRNACADQRIPLQQRVAMAIESVGLLQHMDVLASSFNRRSNEEMLHTGIEVLSENHSAPSATQIYINAQYLSEYTKPGYFGNALCQAQAVDLPHDQQRKALLKNLLNALTNKHVPFNSREIAAQKLNLAVCNGKFNNDEQTQIMHHLIDWQQSSSEMNGLLEALLHTTLQRIS